MASNDPSPSSPRPQPEERGERAEETEDEDGEFYEPYLEVLDSNEEDEGMGASLVAEGDEVPAYLRDAAALSADETAMDNEVAVEVTTALFEVSREVLEIESSVEGGSGGEDGGNVGEGEEDEGEEEGVDGVDGGGGGRGERGENSDSGKTYVVELDRSLSPNCPICFEMWSSDGPHRVR